LTVPDIDLKAGEVTFRETKNGTDHILPLTPYLRRLLERRLAAGKSKWVFSSPHHGRLVGNYRAAVKRVRHAAGIYFIPHDLRRLAATAMERSGVPVYTTLTTAAEQRSFDSTCRKLYRRSRRY
jgi:integrase